MSNVSMIDEPAKSRRIVTNWALMRHDKIMMLAVLFLATVALLAISANVLVDLGLLMDPGKQNLLGRNKPPMFESSLGIHWIGTDQLGRDFLSRLIFGARASFGISLIVICITSALGITLGLVAGYAGGRIDDVIMRIADVQLGFPQMLLALVVLYATGPSILNLILILSLTRWMPIARMIRATTLSLRQSPFVEAAQSIGASDLRIVFLHIMPNAIAPAVVLISLEFGRVMLSEAGLSFLGMGIQPPDSSWGLMLAQGRDYIASAWWLVTFPGLAIALSTLSGNLLAGWMSSVNDPVYRKKMVMRYLQPKAAPRRQPDQKR
jgi:peptide/nickel transport system permease protein